METFTVSIDDSTGESRFLVSPATSFLLDDSSSIKRASHVEPINIAWRICFYILRSLFGEYGKVATFTRAWHIQWRVNLSPVQGPILPNHYSDRSEAINAEIVWLENNFL